MSQENERGMGKMKNGNKTEIELWGILGDPGAVSRVDKMFVVKVYCKIETSP